MNQESFIGRELQFVNSAGQRELEGNSIHDNAK